MFLMCELGSFIGRHPKSILLTTFVFILPILSYFVLFPIIIETDIRRGFAQKDGASLQEFERFANFYNISMYEFEILAVMIGSKNGTFEPLKMSNELCEDIYRLDKFVTSLSLNSTKYGFIHFNDFKVAKVNSAFSAFKLAYGIQNALAPNFDKSIVLSYPNSYIYGYTLSLSTNIFAAEVNDRFQEQGLATAIQSVDAIALFYIVSAHGYINKKRLQQWEIQLLEESEKRNFSKYFDFYLYGDQLANHEAEKGHVKTASMLSVGVILMTTYMAYTMRTLPRKSQILLTFVAISSPLLACAVSFALLGWLGVQYSSIMSLTPLLVLGIGVDDAFLLLHTWRENAYILDASERMRRVIWKIGPSITITSLTNALAFGVGTFSPTRTMSLFCLCTAIAMTLDFILELSFFTPCLPLTLRWEKKTAKMEKQRKVHALWWRYAEFVMSKSGRLCALIVIVLLYVGTFLGIQKMKTTFDASKTFPITSPLRHSINLIDIIYKQYAPINFVISNPPNFTDPNDLLNFMGMVERLESRPEAYGRERTLFWLFNYMEYCRNELGIEMSIERTNYSLSLDYLDSFMKSAIVDNQNMVHYHINEAGQTVIDRFLINVIYKGNAGWYLRAKLSSEIREFLNDYAQYNITLFNYDSSIFDLITTVKKELAKSVLITLCCMMCVCLIFIPNLINMAIATLSILSISCTLLGMLSWCNLDMDPITMVNVLMAIGFSVDFSAHICYHFYNYERTQHPTLLYPNQKVVKLAHILHAVGSPVIQAGASTVICMLPLFTINSYIIRSFAKTVCLVAILGILHGLFIVPSVLSLELCAKRNTTSKPHQRTAVLSLDGTTKESSPMI